MSCVSASREIVINSGTDCLAAAELNALDRFDTWCRRRIERYLSSATHGCLLIHDANGPLQFGSSDLANRVELIVHDPNFYRRTVFGGSLGFAESYLQGEWSSRDLVGTLRFFGRNLAAVQAADNLLSRCARSAARGLHRLSRNSRSGSRKNIQAHYDLGNELFSTFLDETMMYSSGIYQSKESTLHDASVEKLDRICRKLDLQTTDRVLEIGTGWGGFAEYAARNFGCHVTTTTISQQQYEYAIQRVANAGLGEQITVLKCDYRDLVGQYDKLVSIEMIEAVGHEFLETYFAKCSELLKPDGALSIQAITIPEQRYGRYLKNVDFIQKYIFPGGCLPSISRMSQALAKRTDLQIAEMSDFSDDYARTLVDWRKQFFSQIERVKQLGYDERFVRLWEYYLCYCEAGFRERLTGLVQLFAMKPQSRLQPGRTR